MIELAVIAGPIPRIKLLPFITRAYPRSALIRRPGVVSVVPNIAIVGRIPVTIHPDITRSRVVRTNPKHPRRRRCANPDAHGKLRE